jgi:hypothetical protein
MPHDINDQQESYPADAVRRLLSQSVGACCPVRWFLLSGATAMSAVAEIFGACGSLPVNSLAVPSAHPPA